MIWWLWIVVGMVLLGVELLAVDTAFFLVFLGFAAILVGGADGLFGLSGGLDWLLFGVVAGVSLMSFRARAYASFLPPETGEDAARIVGTTCVSREKIQPGAKGQVELRGSPWSAENIGVTQISEGERCQVIEVAGIVLRVRSASDS